MVLIITATVWYVSCVCVVHSLITLSSNTTIDKIQVHANNMLTKDFGMTREVRRVPAHTPLAINVEEMERLQRRYASEYRKTSSNRFRNSDDVQFAFAYFHWLILSSRHLDFEIEQFFSDVVDTNQDGHVSENEMRTIAAIVAGGAPSERDLEDTKECLAPKRTTQKEWADDAGTFLSIYGNIDL